MHHDPAMIYLAPLARAALLLRHIQGRCANGIPAADFDAVGMHRIGRGGRHPRRSRCGFAGALPHFPQLRHSSTGASKAERERRGSASRRPSASVRADDDGRRRVSSVAIVGGGLAGLSTAYHLLDVAKNERGDLATRRRMRITIYDRADVGEGGASSVAGGLIHPFSPRGKLIHLGLPALEHANRLIEAAARRPPHGHRCITRPLLYRVALSDKNVAQLQHAAENNPTLASWMSREEMNDKFGIDSLGGLELGNGCKVVHVPSYLKGLWEECRTKAGEMDGSIEWELMRLPNDEDETTHDARQIDEEQTVGAWKDIDSFNQHLSEYDAVVLSAGAGMLHDGLTGGERELPAQLVRGQSVEMTLQAWDDPTNDDVSDEAFLCGKYVSPLPASAADPLSRRFVVGATHEFGANRLAPDEAMEELRDRTRPLARKLWEEGTVDRTTSGVRVQSQRGKFGRMPIVGRYEDDDADGTTTICHGNRWIFTGLSSRGLIYHGLFGRWLAESVLSDDEGRLRDQFEEFDWWRK